MSFAQPDPGAQGASAFQLNGRPMSTQLFTSAWIPQVRAFNRRMLAGGLNPKLAFPEDPSLEFPRTDGAPIWQEAFLAVEEGCVRGGYYFTHERYLAAGEIRWIAHCRHTISEVVVDKAYKGLGGRLLADARRRQPLLYAGGFGGRDRPYGRLCLADGWSDVSIPFWFQVLRPAAFCRNIAFLRKTPLRRAALDFAASSGLGWLGIKVLQSLRGCAAAPAGYAAQTVPEFGPWADEIWEANRPFLLYAAVRDRDTLNLRYSPANPRFRRVAVSTAGRVIGWALSIDRKMEQNPYFGDMRVGVVADCLAAPGHEYAVVRAAAADLESSGADIIVSNQSFAPWCAAFRKAGFLSGSSNYPLVVSPELARILDPFAPNRPRIHVNRGDGAGISQL